MRKRHTIGLLIGGMALGCGVTLALQGWQQQLKSPQVEARDTTRQLGTALLIKREPSLGSANAPLTIVEFSDFECPYCQRFHELVLPQLKRQYIDAGLVRFVHKDLPLPFHDEAHKAATVARCSIEDGRYWKVYDALFKRQNCLGCLGPEAIAEAAGTDKAKLARCLKRGQAAKAVNANVSEAQLQGIRATPTFVIGQSQGNQHNGLVIEGALPWPQFQQLIETALQRLNR